MKKLIVLVFLVAGVARGQWTEQTANLAVLQYVIEAPTAEQIEFAPDPITGAPIYFHKWRVAAGPVIINWAVSDVPAPDWATVSAGKTPASVRAFARAWYKERRATGIIKRAMAGDDSETAQGLALTRLATLAGGVGIVPTDSLSEIRGKWNTAITNAGTQAQIKTVLRAHSEFWALLYSLVL